ncbi:MAG: hypothetical protein ACXVCY_16830 [Pseudobdellovibrionaceae bacterium]
MKKLITLTILASSLIFATAAHAEIRSQLNCQYKTELYANNKLPFVALPTMTGNVFMQDDTFIMIQFTSTEFPINESYSLVLEPSYMKSGVISVHPELAWNPNGGTLYLKAMLIKKQNNSKTVLGFGLSTSDVISSPKELEDLKKAQATKTHSVSLSVENTEYPTLELNHSLQEMVAMKEQIKDLITGVTVECRYSQVNN